jgi:hypothetical protein
MDVDSTYQRNRGTLAQLQRGGVLPDNCDTKATRVMCPSHFHQRRHFVMVKRYCTNCSSSLRASSLLILPVTNAQRIIAPAANTKGIFQFGHRIGGAAGGRGA